MKYGEYKSKIELCEYIISELSRTIKTMGRDDISSDNEMFKTPRAKRADLIKKKHQVEEKLIKYKNL